MSLDFDIPDVTISFNTLSITAHVTHHYSGTPPCGFDPGNPSELEYVITGIECDDGFELDDMPNDEQLTSKLLQEINNG